MEGERKKRKMDNEEVCGAGGEEEEEDEEKKIEKFFALIKSARDLRDRLRSGVNESKDKEEKRPVEKEIKIWNPKFQPADFTGEDKPKSPGASTPPGPSRREEKEEEREVEEDDRGDGTGLDLNLSL